MMSRFDSILGFQGPELFGGRDDLLPFSLSRRQPRLDDASSFRRRQLLLLLLAVLLLKLLLSKLGSLVPRHRLLPVLLLGRPQAVGRVLHQPTAHDRLPDSIWMGLDHRRSTEVSEEVSVEGLRSSTVGRRIRDGGVDGEVGGLGWRTKGG